MPKSDAIRRIHQLFKGLDALADDFDRLDQMEQTEKEHAKALAAAKATLAEQQTLAKQAAVGANSIVEDAKAYAMSAQAKAKNDADALLHAAEAKVRALDAELAEKAKTLKGMAGDILAATAHLQEVTDRTNTELLREAEIQQRIDTLKAELIAKLGG